jgi:hypothetical protein
MRWNWNWIWIALAAIFVVPIVWNLLKIVLGLTIGLLQFAIPLAIIAAVVIFIVGLVRRMLVMR